MPERKISARLILQDIKQGIDGEGLMTKYQLSFKRLQNTYAHLMEAGLLEVVDGAFQIPPVRRLRAKKIANEIRAGVSAEYILEKYLLSPAQLQKAVEVLLEHKSIRPNQLRHEPEEQPHDMLPPAVREVERCYLDFELPIVDTGPPELDGIVRDLTEKGAGVVGIPSQAGDVKTFLVLHDEFVLIEPFMFEARCRWVTKKEPDGDIVAGYQITHISDKDLGELRKLIHLVSFYA